MLEDLHIPVGTGFGHDSYPIWNECGGVLRIAL